ncbi:hypothetical protein AF6_0244 [Anoxybacillus flavithermus TNO-09.006]|uniref:Uncharacterized protein n=1 Tax=Anoxybacillus flavithermus TaxID=33934 RepID=A0A178TNR5_9BACL|nr:hypothetical protein AF6_0244 [Anoxybacillus flavithermus TNO-09.006]OAO80027.1 hypothetical protein TAF16_1273 [Anoxybacillus flavithermus]OAO81801.1 hypothetical protein A0O32_1037 [Anoxybacillus flavithermus]
MLDLCRINDKNVYCFIVENLKGVNPGSGYTQEAIETVFPTITRCPVGHLVFLFI